MKTKVASIEADKGLQAKSDAELLATARWNGSRSNRAGDSAFENISLMYLDFVVYVEKAMGYIVEKQVPRLIRLLSNYEEVDGVMARACNNS